MKLVTLNTWSGRVPKPLTGFLIEYSKKIDVFCFQEILHDPKGVFNNTKGVPGNWQSNLFLDISKILSTFDGFFRPFVHNAYGLASFTKKDLELTQEGDIFVYKERDHDPHIDDTKNHARNIQFLKFKVNGKPLTIINFHGLWNGKGKTDTEDRIDQSRRIVEFMKTLNGPFILCGDYNLLPDTKSLQILENAGLRNLIKEYNVKSTRTHLYPRANTNSTFADYILVSSRIKVNDFKVLPDVVSDHAPLFLDFEVM